MDKHEHTLRKQLRTAIEQGMTASLSVGEAVEVATMAAEVFSTAVRPSQKELAFVYVVSWPMPNQPMRQALGFINKKDALFKANAEDGAEIFKLEIF